MAVIGDLDTLIEMAQRAKSGTPDWSRACFQCESYMRAVRPVEPYTPERLGELVSARLERQSVIGRAYGSELAHRVIQLKRRR